MVIQDDLDEYLLELRRQVCDQCVARRANAPPCSPLGIECGIERHLSQLIEICRTVDSPLIDPYLDRLNDEICAKCEFRDQPVCPCPLKYLLPLAVSAVETVEQRRQSLIVREIN